MQTLEESRELLLEAVSGADITFYRYLGNRGDDLIEVGTRALLDGAGIPYRFLHAEDIKQYEGDLLLVGGGGGWSRFWRHSPSIVIDAHGRFQRIVVFPSTFDMEDPLTAYVLRTAELRLFGRELVSAALPGVEFAHCPSFFYPFKRLRHGRGVLHAFRTDHESAMTEVPPDNIDVSSINCSLEAWLSLLAGYAEIHTDRAHVLVAAALLGKRARWRANGYFKVAALAETLADYDVEELP